MSSRAQLIAKFSQLAGLREVESLIQSKLTSDVPQLTEISSYLLTLGGKRMRPVLSLLVAQACGSQSPSRSILALAAGLELIHMATLLHDDIIDRSPLRRHKMSPYRRYGMESTLLCGDFLLTRAFSLCAHLDDYVIDATEQACVELTEGEILESPLYKSSHTLQSALRISEKKTAALFRLAADAASHLSGVTPEVNELFSEFGTKLGIAFQILDDVLDVTADEKTLGKMAGIDICERKPSVVNIFWLESGAPEAKILLTPPDEKDTKKISDLLLTLRRGNAIQRSRDLAAQYAEGARENLKRLTSLLPAKNDAFHTLDLLVSYTLERLG